MITLPEIPDRIAALPRDERGYPVPKFVEWIDGKPEFRVADRRFFVKCVQQKLCWICGQELNLKKAVFVCGPVTLFTHCHAEPPCHEECAIFAVKACPFLVHPNAVRREANMPQEASAPAGDMIADNPGITLLWYCNGYELKDDGLFTLPNPCQVRFWKEGRKATRAEIMVAVDNRVGHLRDAAKLYPTASGYVERAIAAGMKYVPRSVD